MEENNFKEAKLLDIDSVRIVRYLVIDGYCVIYFRKITKDYNISVIKKEIGPDDILFPEPDGVDNAILEVVKKALELPKARMGNVKLNSEYLFTENQKEDMLKEKKNTPSTELILCGEENRNTKIHVFGYDESKPIHKICEEDFFSKTNDVEFL